MLRLLLINERILQTPPSPMYTELGQKLGIWLIRYKLYFNKFVCALANRCSFF